MKICYTRIRQYRVVRRSREDSSQWTELEPEAFSVLTASGSLPAIPALQTAMPFQDASNPSSASS